MLNHEIATINRKGLAPKLSGVATDVLRGDGSYGTVPGVGAWASYVPTRTGWTDVGTPTVTARYCQLGALCFVQIKVVPSTTIATVAGSSYVSLPLACGASSIGGDGSMENLTTLVAIGICTFDVANSRLYVPSQGATANTLTISAWYEV